MRRTRSGAMVDVPLPAMGTDALTLCAPTRERALENAKALGLYGCMAVEVDDNDRLVGAEKGLAS